MTEPTLADPLEAVKLAYLLHGSQRDADGQRHTDHVERVAFMVPKDCKAVAWLHDVVEDTDTTLDDLRDYGLPRVDLLAVELLTRDPLGIYGVYIRRIAGAPEEPGRKARIVKEADLLDNLTRSLRGGDEHRIARYRRALIAIQSSMVGHLA